MRRRGLSSVVVGVLVIAGLTVGGGRASGIPTCEYDGVDTVDITLDSSFTVGINHFLSSDDIVLDFPIFTDCGAATDANTDTIVVHGVNTNQPQTVIVDLASQFAPGATTEATGDPEIEIQIDFAGGTGFNQVFIVGSSGADVVRFGANGINFNDDDDADITFTSNAPSRLDIRGNGGGDTIAGDASVALGSDPYTGATQLFGGPGDDLVVGGTGGDVIFETGLSNGSDSLFGRAGIDTLDYSDRTADLDIDQVAPGNDGEDGEGDNVFVDIENFNLGSGDDFFQGAFVNNTVFGNAGEDEIRGGGGADDLHGDSFSAAGESDELHGEAGNDILRPGPDVVDDIADGGDDVDFVDYATRTENLTVFLDGSNGTSGAFSEGDTVSAEQVTTGSGNDTVHGTVGDNTVFSGSGFDTIYGSDGDDILQGGSDNDDLIGGAGADRFDGGAGIDEILYPNSSAVSVNLATRVLSGGDAAGDTINNEFGVQTPNTGGTSTVESVTGSSADDELIGDDQANDLFGGGGVDLLDGAAGADRLRGGPGADSIDGGDANNDILDYTDSASAVSVDLSTASGSAGDASGDILCSQAFPTCTGGPAVRVETVFGSAHDDVLVGDAAGNSLSGGNGDDTLAGLGGGDALAGDSGSDTLDYSASPSGVTVDLDALTASGGHAQNDSIDTSAENVIGSAFVDTLTGTSGANTFSGLAGGDTMTGGGGSDTLDYSASNEGVTVNLGTGQAFNGHGNGDVFVGNDFDNVIGSAFADSMVASAGANHFEAGAGSDYITYSPSLAAVNVDLLSGTADGGFATGDTFTGVENVAGSAFDDFVAMTEATNSIDGSAGSDTVSYATSTAPVTVDLATNFGSGGFATGDFLLDVENVIGSNGNDTFVGDASPNAFSGQGGIDTVSYAAMTDRVVADADDVADDGVDSDGDKVADEGDNLASDIENITGGAGHDILGGNALANLLLGGAGNDKLSGLAGNDILKGQGGSKDAANGGPGKDKCSAEKEISC